MFSNNATRVSHHVLRNGTEVGHVEDACAEVVAYGASHVQEKDVERVQDVGPVAVQLLAGQLQDDRLGDDRVVVLVDRVLGKREHN